MILLLLTLASPARAETRIWFHPWKSTAEIATILRAVPDGRALLASAEKKDPQFLQHVSAGNASSTEDLLTATLNAFDGEDHTGTAQQITLKKDLPLSDAVADLAHEIVHFTERPPFDPYRSGLVLKTFVRENIEGKGGELAAFATECKVAWEIEKDDPSFPQHKFCQRYRLPGNKFALEAARHDYYAIGSWLTKASTSLKKNFPELTMSDPVFTSGISRKPYPISLNEEFSRTRIAVCDLNRKKYLLTRKSTAPPSELMAERKRLEDFHAQNCR
ncbi:MAG: hypothetical protein ACXVB9_05460 [Bdellovibrionota bacterium]